MKKRILKLLRKEAIRHAEEIDRLDEIKHIFGVLVANYYKIPRRERGKYRLALEELNEDCK